MLGGRTRAPGSWCHDLRSYHLDARAGWHKRRLDRVSVLRPRAVVLPVLDSTLFAYQRGGRKAAARGCRRLGVVYVVVGRCLCQCRCW